MAGHAEQRLRFKLIRRRTKHAQRSKAYPSRPHRRHEGAAAAAYRQPRQTRFRAGWERSARGNSAWRRECRTGSFGPVRYESPTKKVIPQPSRAQGTFRVSHAADTRAEPRDWILTAETVSGYAS